MIHSSEKRYAVGVDLGGTKIAAAVVDHLGEVHVKVKVPAIKGDVAASIRQIADAARQAVERSYINWEQVEGVGVCIPGIYFAESGEAWAPNLWGKERVALCYSLGKELPDPLVIDSDRAAHVLGEQWLGAARGLSDVVLVAVGTGIGAGIITGGRLCRGAGDVAGAVGWFALNPLRKEEYAQKGCFEAEAAGPAVARKAAERFAAGETSLLSNIVGDEHAAITTEMVVEAALEGDQFARSVLDDIARYLGMGIANIISILNPQAVVLGGGLMNTGDLLLEQIRREVAEWAQPVAAEQARIELSRLGEDAGLLGAARFVFLSRNN